MDIKLTPREISILREILKGKSYKEISKTLFISVPTVKHYVATIAEKFGVRRKIDIILFVFQHNLMDKYNYDAEKVS